MKKNAASLTLAAAIGVTTAFAGAGNAFADEVVAPGFNQDVAVAENADASDASAAEADEAPAAEDEEPSTDEAEKPSTDEAEKPAKDEAEQSGEKYDLKPEIRVAAGKSAGFAGLVSISAKNVGSEIYYQDFPATSFRIDVHTEKGPKGVDRLITPGWFNGAYTRDLGFDKDKSVRSFEVTLSNPINPGESKLLANLNFGDGKTKLGRLENYITVTQTGRLEEDKSNSNDQNVDSREVTTTDVMHKPTKGLF
ncbi:MULTISPECIES: neuraminidase [unclassified Corynebacterium]|uniref:neuraminidase n=1 Tax=unclassified Corynebacterium TaxID=2624378 RepID=UPI001EF6CD37|nr:MULTISPECIES: neuraminidase [unclassified Corynebacterium]MCG7259123.1 neuraminidase [Corynebacterium sp. ACRQK]MCG7263421.1 neuraminidase [Corynebacterium sp. ACRQL]